MPHHHCNGEAFEHVTSPTGLPVYAKQYIAKVGDTNNHGTPRERMKVGLECDTLPPISQTPTGHLHTPVIGARVERICIQSLRYHLWEANQTHQSHHEYQPLPRLPDRHPRHNQHGIAIQARSLPPDRDIPSDVRGSCGCSGAGSQPSRQARQLWLPLFPALTGLSRDQSGWLSSLTGRIPRARGRLFQTVTSLIGTVIHLAAAMQVRLGGRQRGLRQNIGMMSWDRGTREKLARV